MRIDFRIHPHEVKVLIGVGFFFLIVTAALILPPSGSHEMSRMNIIKNDIKHIGTALADYNDQHGHFPPAGKTSTDTQPVCSWRVSILPHIGRSDLYEAYDQSRAWNAPLNDVVADTQIEQYCDYFDKEAPWFIKIAAITGNGTVWDPSETYEELSDSAIVAVQVSGSDIRWAEPRDLSLSQLKGLVERDGEDITIREANIGPLVLFADTVVYHLSDQCPLDRLLKLTTIQGAKEHNRRELLGEYGAAR